MGGMEGKGDWGFGILRDGVAVGWGLMSESGFSGCVDVQDGSDGRLWHSRLYDRLN